MIDDFTADFKRCCQVDYNISAMSLIKSMRVFFLSYGLQVLATQRLYRWSFQKTSVIKQICKLPLIPISFFLYEIFSRLYDIKISGHAVIGAGCYIGHFGGIRIGRCQIGKQCNVNHQVKIGGFSHKDSNKSVMIDDHVWIGAHSKIMNSVSIGKGATISAGTVVASNIQDKVLVAGPASRVLKCNYDNAVLLGFGE